MEHEISRRFNDDILAEARARFGISAQEIEALDGFESFIFEYQKAGRPYILRIGHSRRRTPALIQGEVDWINYLAAGGAGVARAILSEDNQLVESISDREDGQFLATAFVKAPGGPAHATDRWGKALFEPYGRLLGRIHKLTRTYEPSDPAWHRPQWDDDISINLDKLLPAQEENVRARYHELMATLQKLPQGADSYGLIHQDAHAGNFFVDEEYNITLFDFDDAVYSWFIYDIAMVMFYAITNQPEPEAQLAELWPLFMKGYLAENELDSCWFAEIPAFMKLRELDLYAVLIDIFGYESSGDRWIDSFMNGRQAKLIDDIPYVNFEFAL